MNSTPTYLSDTQKFSQCKTIVRTALRCLLPALICVRIVLPNQNSDFLQNDYLPAAAGVAGSVSAMQGENELYIYNPASAAFNSIRSFYLMHSMSPEKILTEYMSVFMPDILKKFNMGIALLYRNTYIDAYTRQFENNGDLLWKDIRATLSFSRKTSKGLFKGQKTALGTGFNIHYAQSGADKYVGRSILIDAGISYPLWHKGTVSLLAKNFGFDLRYGLIPDWGGYATPFEIRPAMSYPFMNSKLILSTEFVLQPYTIREDFVTFLGGVRVQPVKILVLRGGIKTDLRDNTIPTAGGSIILPFSADLNLSLDYSVTWLTMLGMEHSFGTGFNYVAPRKPIKRKPRVSLKKRIEARREARKKK